VNLVPGTRFGPYEIVSPLGAGGMGEVYRARDARLQRDVAIKVLPELFAADPERRMRFEREAQTLAALNHPNIAQVFGVVEVPRQRDDASTSVTAGADTVALVMELVEGKTLGDVIDDTVRKGSALPIADLLGIAIQIADGLEAAHDRGIVHRDLKPANIKVRDDGTVKLLDFGLAKALSEDLVPQGEAATNSPTFTSPAMTQMGVILGTAAYMAPEQARGRTVDRRADIWAFGCLLYEMLTGRQPFRGEDVSLTLAAILTEPVDYSALPASVPAAVHRLLRRCLERDPRKRLSSIADARLELHEAMSEPIVPATAVTSTGRRRAAPVVWTTGGALLAAAVFYGGLGWGRSRPPDAGVVRSSLVFEAPLKLSGNRAFTLHPDGTEVVFAGESKPGEWSLYRRRLNDARAELIAGTDDSEGPFFSPDAQWLGFIQHGRLKKQPVAGGAAIDLGEAPGMQGGLFTADGSIIFNPQHGEGLERIQSGSTERHVLTTVDRAKGEAGHHWPHLLPDGKHVLFTIEQDGKPYSEGRIMILSLDTGEQRLLIDGGTDARYLPTGDIVYWRDNALWRIPFDLRSLQVSGTPIPVLRDVMLGEPNGMAHFDVADNGTIVYLSGRDTQSERGLMLVDRAGHARQIGDRRAFETVSIAPDGARIVGTIIAANDSLWLTEIDRSSFTRLTFESENSRAIWSPDGARIALARHRGGESRKLWIMPADGSSGPELLRDSPQTEVPDSWTAAGDLLAFTRNEPSGLDIWVLDMKTQRARPILASRFTEVHPRFSPDGKWLAYVSDESGQFEVYVRPFPGPGPKRLVSNDGGTEPHWRADGQEIFYRIGDAVMAADVTTTGQFRASVPHLLFRGDYRTAVNWPTWDVLPSGQAFLLIQDFAKPRTSLNMIQNWFEEVRGPRK
jgi:serine/threonine-protein kinase